MKVNKQVKNNWLDICLCIYLFGDGFVPDSWIHQEVVGRDTDGAPQGAGPRELGELQLVEDEGGPQVVDTGDEEEGSEDVSTPHGHFENGPMVVWIFDLEIVRGKGSSLRQHREADFRRAGPISANEQDGSKSAVNDA